MTAWRVSGRAGSPPREFTNVFDATTAELLANSGATIAAVRCSGCGRDRANTWLASLVVGATGEIAACPCGATGLAVEYVPAPSCTHENQELEETTAVGDLFRSFVCRGCGGTLVRGIESLASHPQSNVVDGQPAPRWRGVDWGAEPAREGEPTMDDREERRYENHQPGHNKFWSVKGPYRTDDGDARWLIECRWGACGSQGQHKEFPFLEYRAAARFRDDKIAEKLGRGYSFASATPRVDVAVEMPNYDEATDTYVRPSRAGGLLAGALEGLGRSVSAGLTRVVDAELTRAMNEPRPRPTKKQDPNRPAEMLLCRGCEWSRPIAQYRDPPSVCPNCFGSLMRVWKGKGPTIARGVDHTTVEAVPSKPKRMITLGKKS